jgi:hypothetical protein
MPGIDICLLHEVSGQLLVVDQIPYKAKERLLSLV